MIPDRAVLTVISGLAALTAIAADVRETRAATDSHVTEVRPSNHRPVAQRPSEAPSPRAATPVSRVHSSRTAQKHPLQGNAIPPNRSDKAPKIRQQSWPQPRSSAEAPAPSPPTPAADEHTPAPHPPSACQRRLTPDFAVVRPLPPITGPNSCGADDVVLLEAVVLEDGQRVALAPAATLRCPMAEAVVRWIRETVAPAAVTLGSSARTIITAGSYECRERDRVPGAKLSEHSRANALDLRGLTLANGTVVDLTDKAVSKEFLEVIRQSACNTFTTVLGPGSDESHANNVHLDLIERKGNYRICQWDVLTAPEVGSTMSPEHRNRTNGPK